jgi:hypothetical protein
LPGLRCGTRLARRASRPPRLAALGRHLECGNSVCLPVSGSPGLALVRGPSYSRLAAREKQTAS